MWHFNVYQCKKLLTIYFIFFFSSEVFKMWYVFYNYNIKSVQTSNSSSVQPHHTEQYSPRSGISNFFSVMGQREL